MYVGVEMGVDIRVDTGADIGVIRIPGDSDGLKEGGNEAGVVADRPTKRAPVGDTHVVAMFEVFRLPSKQFCFCPHINFNFLSPREFYI
jgi:hypothetical protein